MNYLFGLSSNIYFLIALIGLSTALGDAFINQYVKTDKLWWFFAGCFGWCIAALFLSQVLRQQNFAPSIALFFIGNISVASLIGYFYFGDRVSAMQWMWIVVAIVAMVFIVRGN